MAKLYNIEYVHKDNIIAGDTILRHGHPVTVCAKDITYNTFMGISIFGDSYCLGCKPVKKVCYNKRTKTIKEDYYAEF